MFVGWTTDHPGMGVVTDLDDCGDCGPHSVRGDLMDYDEVQLAGDGELFIKSPYVTWKPEDTRIVSYVLWRPHPTDPRSDEPKLRQGWRMAPTARAARFEVTKQFGQILEENAAGDHVFFRVYKEKR